MWAWVRHNIVMLTSPVLFTDKARSLYSTPKIPPTPPVFGESAVKILIDFSSRNEQWIYMDGLKIVDCSAG